MKTLKLTVAALAATGIAALGATPALAVHEANNTIDFAPVDANSPADAKGVSNFAQGNPDPAKRWQNHIKATDLVPFATYTWVGIAQGTATPICTFMTNAFGDGKCDSGVNSRLGRTEVRLGEGITGAPVLTAAGCPGPDDANGGAGDGQIERHGSARHPESPDCPS